MNTKTDFKFGEVYRLADQIQEAEDKVQFRNILATSNGGVSIVGFKAGQFLDEHVAPAEVMVYVIEGEIDFNMAGNTHTLKGGEFLLMGADVLHQVKANTDSKLMLVKVKS